MKQISKCTLSMALFAVTMTAGGYAANASDITVMGYRGPFEENYVKSVIELFMKGHPDIKVTYFGVQNAATSLGNMRAQRDAPQVNAVIYDLSVAKIAQEEGLVADLNTDKIPNYVDISEVGKDLGGGAIQTAGLNATRVPWQLVTSPCIQ